MNTSGFDQFLRIGFEYGTKAADSMAGLHRKLPIDIENLPIALWVEKINTEEPFGVARIASLTGRKDRAARNLLALMREHKLVSDVKGHGKGRVCFCRVAYRNAGEYLRNLKEIPSLSD